MAAYESIYVLRPDLDDEAVAKVTDRISTLVAENGGTVVAVEKMGRRRLAYEVKGHLEGYYVVLNYEGTGATTSELERTYKISDEVIRYIIVKREVPYRPAAAREAAREGAPAGASGGAAAGPAKETPGQAAKETSEPEPAAVPTDRPEAAGAPAAPDTAGTAGAGRTE